MTGSFFTITVPANSSRREVVSGKFFTCVSLTNTLSVRPSNGSELDLNAGREFGDASQEFSALTFYNRTGAAITTTFYAGPVPYKADPSVVATIAALTVNVESTITHKATTTLGSGIIALASGGSSAAITNTNGKQITFQNHATSAGALQVKDASGNIAAVLQPGDPPFAMETSGTFILTASGGAVDYSWLKLIYT